MSDIIAEIADVGMLNRLTILFRVNSAAYATTQFCPSRLNARYGIHDKKYIADL